MAASDLNAADIAAAINPASPTDLAAVQAALAQGDGLSAAKLVSSAAAQVRKALNPRRIALIGASFAAANDPDTGLAGYGYITTPAGPGPYTDLKERPSSFMGWFCILSGNQFQYNINLNKGKSGSNSSEDLARFDSVIPQLGAGILIIDSGANDPSALSPPISPTQTFANIKAMANKANILGMRVFVISQKPRGTSTDVAKRSSLYVNALLWEFCRSTPGVTYVDFWGPIARPEGTDAQPIGTYMQGDTIHPGNMIGGYVLGKALWQAFQSVGYGYPVPLRNYNLGTSKSYSATTNPFGNRLANSAMVGTAGVVQANVTGTMADSWLAQWASRSTGAAVGSQVQRRDGLGLCQRLLLTAAGGQINETIQITPTPNAYAPAGTPGAVSVFRLGVNISGAVNFRGIQIWMRYRTNADGTGPILLEVSQNYDQFGILPETAWYGVMETEPLAVPSIAAGYAADALSVEIFVKAALDGTGSGSTVAIDFYDSFYGAIPTDAEVFG